MSDDLEPRSHHAITHDGETYIKLADASVTFSLYRKDIAAKDAEITRLRARVAVLEVALKAAAENINDWGAYASQYFQEKWDLEGDVKRYIAIAEGKLPYRARHPMETWKNE